MLTSGRRSTLVFGGLCVSFVLAAGLAVSTLGQPVPRPISRPVRPSHPADVVGTLTLMVAANDSETVAAIPPSQRVELPDIDVYLRNAVSGAVGPKKKTQLDGKFYLAAPSPGTYTVCWDAPGIGAGCGSRFTVGLDNVYLKVVPVRALPGVIYGKA